MGRDPLPHRGRDVSIARKETVEDFLALFQVDDFPATAADDYAEIRVALERKGTKIGSYDLLIAAHARHINATLVTGNEREFRRVPGLGSKLAETLALV